MLYSDINIQVEVSSTEHYCGLSPLNFNFYLKNRTTDTTKFWSILSPTFFGFCLFWGIVVMFWFVGLGVCLFVCGVFSCYFVLVLRKRGRKEGGRGGEREGREGEGEEKEKGREKKKGRGREREGKE